MRVNEHVDGIALAAGEAWMPLWLMDIAMLIRDRARELGRATELVTRIVEALRALEAKDPDSDARKIRALGPGVHLMNDLERVNKVRDGELLFLARRDREVDIEVSLVDVGPRLRDDLWGAVTAVLTSHHPRQPGEESGPRWRLRRRAF